MAQREDIKYRLADAAKRSLRDGTVDSLTVSRIAREAGVTRQTFYRNFADKYDLVNWYFDKLLLESFEHMGSGRTVREGYERKFEFIRQESVFFRAAFRSNAQNSLRDHDLELILRFFTDLIRKKNRARAGSRPGLPPRAVLLRGHRHDGELGARRDDGIAPGARAPHGGGSSGLAGAAVFPTRHAVNVDIFRFLSLAFFREF